jgi:hypothetical protein
LEFLIAEVRTYVIGKPDEVISEFGCGGYGGDRGHINCLNFIRFILIIVIIAQGDRDV